MTNHEKLIQKLVDADIEIEDVEKVIDNNGEEEILKFKVAKFPRGRDFVQVRLDSRIEDRILLASSFEQYKYIKDYEGIWSSQNNVIECELMPLIRHMMPTHYMLRRLTKFFSDGGEESEWDESTRFEFEKSEDGIQISIGGASTEFAILSDLKGRISRFEYSKKRPTLRIENIEVSKHDNARNMLEKIGNSILFKLDLSLNIGLKLAEDRESRRFFIRRKDAKSDLDKGFPAYEYDNEPMSLYWYAKSAIEMPLLQFLAYYQVLEFYFPIYSQKEAHNAVKNIIKDPRFNPNKDSDITKILSTININKNQLGFGSELEQLKSTIVHCVSTEEIKEHIQQDENMLNFYIGKKAKGLSNKNINISNPTADLLNEVSERIYEIRCRVVHTKSSDKNYDLLIPSSPEIKDLIYDISILEMIVRRVLIASSRLMKL